MATPIPIEDNLQTICAVANRYDDVFQEKARQALQKKNDVEAILDDVFNNPKFYEEISWNEGQFSADRDGTNVPSFSIHRPDEPGIVLNGIAPSRPPSRTGNRSPLGAPTSQEQADADLAAAIAASAGVSGGATPQESGVTEPAQPMFGPANRSNYEHDEWAMVRTSSDTPDPPPSLRMRDSAVPVFLRCRQTISNKKHRLGPVLMIFHEIPAARNVLLKSGTPPITYGQDNSWWKGQKIPTPSAQLSADSWESTNSEVNLSHELQRLMAFLDATSRSYGTADALLDVPPVNYHWGDVVNAGFTALAQENDAEKIRPIWTDVKMLTRDEQSGEISETYADSYGILELSVPGEHEELMKTLYDMWDWLFWMDLSNKGYMDQELNKTAYIDEPSQVLTMRLKNIKRTFEIPDVFYMDRYLKENKTFALDTQDKMGMAMKAIAQGKEAMKDLNKFVSPSDSLVHDKSFLMREVIERDEKKIARVKADALWRKHEASVGTEDYFPYLPGQLDGLAELNQEEEKVVKAVQAHIDLFRRKLNLIEQTMSRIEAEISTCEAYLQQLGKKLTVPNEKPELNPTHGYTLRGVVTSPEIVYMRKREEADLIQLDDAAPAAPVEQWWRLAWIGQGDNSLSYERTTDEKVREAIFSESMDQEPKAPILIYASEKAMAEERLPLSSALQTFIKFDNRLFKQELLEEPNPRERKRTAIQSPQSPPKRQYRGRSDSMDSMAAHRSDGGYSDDDERDLFANDDAVMTDGVLEDYKPPTPPTTYDASSSPKMGRQALRLANVSLVEEESGMKTSAPQQEVQPEAQAQNKSPEMQQRVPDRIVRPHSTLIEQQVPIMERAMTMDIDTVAETPTDDGAPENYYK